MFKLFLYLLISMNLVASEFITPIPLNVQYDKQKASLGKKLFLDTRLSKDNTIACVSCHLLDGGGDDNAKFSTGIDSKLGSINSPTVYNSRYNIAQFWDGRAKDLKEQAKGPVSNPVEMGSNFKEVIQKLNKDTKLRNSFKKLYHDGITENNIADAIAEFEKALVTPNSPFDKFIYGDKDAISQDIKDGYTLFKEYGCISCHNGINVGGNLFQKVGVFKKFTTDVKALGKFDVTGKENDINYFKVPSLRNIEKTAPYFHDGSEHNLSKAIQTMFEVQLGIEPEPEELDKILKFLKSLNGELPKIIGEN